MKNKELGIEIPDYPGYYVTSEGHIWSTRRKKTKKLKQQKASQSKKGYFQVRLFNENTRRDGFCKDGRVAQKGKLFYVHRLVYETFIGEIPADKEIDHIDGDTQNNSVHNLQVITRRENILKYAAPKGKKYLRNYRDEILEDYKKLRSMPAVAQKWNTSKGVIRRVIKNIYYTRLFKNGEMEYSTRTFDESLPKDKWMTIDLKELSKKNDKHWL